MKIVNLNMLVSTSLKPCFSCGQQDLTRFENNVPGQWYAVIECDNYDCKHRPEIYGSDLADVDKKWNELTFKTYMYDENRPDHRELIKMLYDYYNNSVSRTGKNSEIESNKSYIADAIN